MKWRARRDRWAPVEEKQDLALPVLPVPLLPLVLPTLHDGDIACLLAEHAAGLGLERWLTDWLRAPRSERRAMLDALHRHATRTEEENVD